MRPTRSAARRMGLRAWRGDRSPLWGSFQNFPTPARLVSENVVEIDFGAVVGVIGSGQRPHPNGRAVIADLRNCWRFEAVFDKGPE